MSDVFINTLLVGSQLFIHDVPVECINQASESYQVSAKTIISVLNNESGHNGLEHKNANGSVDYGSMQINSVWLPILKKYGIRKEDLRDDPCTNVNVGAWILSQAIADGMLQEKPYWESVAGYHSKTKTYNQQYRRQVIKQYQYINKILK